MLAVISSHATLAVVLLIGAGIFALLTPPHNDSTPGGGAPTPNPTEGR